MSLQITRKAIDRALDGDPTALRLCLERQPLEAKNASNVQYFISDQPLTAEEWEAKFCTGN